MAAKKSNTGHQETGAGTEAGIATLARLQAEAAAEYRSHSIIPHNLSLLNMEELKILHTALDLATEALLGVVNQPRCRNDEGTRLNGAGNEIGDVMTYLDHYKTAVLKVAKQATPITAKEVENRAWLLIRAESHYEDGLYQMAKLVGEQVAHLSEAEWRDRHRERQAK